MRAFYWCCTSLLKASFHLLYRVEVKGLENIPKGKAIIAPNHFSYLDPPLLGATCPEELFGLAKKELFTVPLLGFFIRKMNAVPTGTSAILQMKCLIECLNENKKVMLFPEGARSSDGILQTPLKSGVVYLANKANAPIVPVVIQGTFEAWPPHKKWPKIGSKITIHYKKPLYWSDFSSLGEKIGREELLQRLTAELK